MRQVSKFLIHLLIIGLDSLMIALVNTA